MSFDWDQKLFTLFSEMKPIHLVQKNKGNSPPPQQFMQQIVMAQYKQHKVNLDLDKNIMTQALRHSYTRQLAGRQEVDLDEIMDNVVDYVKLFVPEEETQSELEEFWCIVGLNEFALNNASSGVCSCSHIPFNGDFNRLNLYQLFIGLGKRQLRFQSLSDSSKFYIINMDTVRTVLAFSDVYDSNSQNHIKVIVEDTYDFDFYFTPHTMPFRSRELFEPKKCEKICSDIARHTDQIIRAFAKESKGLLYNLRSKELPDENFLQHRYATEQQFTRYCQTGDVILFRDNHTFAKVQRFFTNSECDHIGMIFRDQKYGICIFQSNSGTGVSLAMWNQLVRYRWFQNIQGIYWRRLNMQSKPVDFQDKVKEFIKDNLHKQYGISISKLMRSKDIEYKDAEQQRSRTYFCSQLVAAIYKYLNLLQPDKASSTYLPKDFTDKGSLNMINNTALEAERRLIFNEKILKETYHFYR